MDVKNNVVPLYLLLCLSLVLVLSSCAGGSPAAVSSQPAEPVDLVSDPVHQGEWAMEGYNPQRTRATSDQTSPPLHLDYEFKVGGETQFGSPVGIAGGLLFVEGWRKLHALPVEGGEETWFFDLPGSFLSPAIAGNQVFVRAESGEQGYIFALTADSGLKSWQFKFPRVGSTGGNFGGHATSPVVVDGLVLVGASRTFHALDAESGEQVWTFNTEEPVTSSASIAEETVYFVDFTNLYAIDLKTGTERWRFIQNGLGVLFAPIVIGEHLVTAGQDTVHLLDRANGEEVWQKTITDERLIPAGATEDQIFVKSTNRLYALDRLTGEELWSFEVLDFVSLPAITADLIYVITRTGGTSQLRAIDLIDGQEIWREDNARLANAAPVVAQGRVYVRTVDGRVLAYN